MKRQLFTAALLAILTTGCVSTTTTSNKSAEERKESPKDAAAYNTQLAVAYLREGNLAAAREKIDRALSQDEIQSNINQQIYNAPNLVGRWGLNEGTGVAASDSTLTPAHGTLHGNYSWVSGAPFDVLNVPSLPVLNAPASGAAGVSMSLHRATADRHHRRSARSHNLTGYRAAAAAIPQDLGTLMLAALRQGARD